MKKIYQHISKRAFWFSLSLSVILIIVSFILPPTGAIDPSVLAATGELFAFATLATVIDAIKKGSDVTIKKNDIEVTVQNPDGNIDIEEK